MKIVAVAIKKGDLIISLPKPARHHDVLQAMWKIFSEDSTDYVDQGFLTDEGTYLDREQAIRLVEINGQELVQPFFQMNALFSENLW